jgi:hypothetical protein
MIAREQIADRLRRGHEAVTAVLHDRAQISSVA